MIELFGAGGTQVVARVDPSPLRWLIGVELARYRNTAGLSLIKVSPQVGMSKSKLGDMETGRQQQDPEDIAKLLKLYGAQQRDIDRLTSLTGRADEATWWAPWAQVVPDWFKTLVGLEALASREFVYEPIVLPGLLQTEDYAREVTRGTQRVRPDHGERFVSFRMARARRLSESDQPLQLHAIIAEAALQLRVGTEAIRHAQFQHILALSELPNVTIQVVRPEDGLHAAYTGSFVILDFESARSIGYSELHDGAVYAQDPEQVWSYTMSAENLEDVALDPAESVEFIRTLISP